MCEASGWGERVGQFRYVRIIIAKTIYSACARGLRGYHDGCGLKRIDASHESTICIYQWGGQVKLSPLMFYCALAVSDAQGFLQFIQEN